MNPTKNQPFSFKNTPLTSSRSKEQESEKDLIEEFTATIKSFAKAHLGSLLTNDQQKVSRELMTKAGDAGLLGLSIPTEYGGFGLSLLSCSQIIEQVARFESGFSTSIGLHNGLGVVGLVKFAHEGLKAKYLPGLASGKLIAAFAATEPEAGSHISNVKTVATYREQTGQLQLNGSKIYVTNGGLADIFTLLIQTPDFLGYKKGLSLIVVDKHTPGVSIGAEELKMGIKSSSTTSLFLENVNLDCQNIIGIPGKALEYLEVILSWGRTLMSAGCLGVAKSSFAKARSHALHRIQFNVPLVQNRLIQNKLVGSAQYIFTMQAVLAAVGKKQLQQGDASIVFESTLTKILCSEYSSRVADDAIQILGGGGFIEENGVAKNYRDLRITRIFEGSNEMLRLHMAMQVFSWNEFARHELSSKGCQVPAELAEHYTVYEACFEKWQNTLAAVKKEMGFNILKNQQVMAQIAQMTMALHSALMVLVFAENTKSADWALAVVYESQKIVEQTCNELLTKEPYSVSHLTEQLLANDSRWE